MNLLDLNKLGKIYKKEKGRVWIETPREKIIEVCEKLREGGINRVISVSGYDNGKEIEVLYHFEQGDDIVNLKVRVPKDVNVVESITPVFPSANLFERELAEMLGIDVKGHPDLRKLFLPPEINHPLRKGD